MTFNRKNFLLLSAVISQIVLGSSHLDLDFLQAKNAITPVDSIISTVFQYNAENESYTIYEKESYGAQHGDFHLKEELTHILDDQGTIFRTEHKIIETEKQELANGWETIVREQQAGEKSSTASEKEVQRFLQFNEDGYQTTIEETERYSGDELSTKKIISTRERNSEKYQLEEYWNSEDSLDELHYTKELVDGQRKEITKTITRFSSGGHIRSRDINHIISLPQDPFMWWEKETHSIYKGADSLIKKSIITRTREKKDHIMNESIVEFTQNGAGEFIEEKCLERTVERIIKADRIKIIEISEIVKKSGKITTNTRKRKEQSIFKLPGTYEKIITEHFENNQFTGKTITTKVNQENGILRQTEYFNQENKLRYSLEEEDKPDKKTIKQYNADQRLIEKRTVSWSTLQ